MTSDLFNLPTEYQDLRESVRALAEKEIAPHAHAVDEDHRYPQEAADALIKANLHAAHVPDEFGGEGADALAVAIIIEEVARVCASSSLIPAVNKLAGYSMEVKSGFLMRASLSFIPSSHRQIRVKDQKELPHLL